ncbi:hypothetical protein NDU88_000634 [Pleurodeles waltl]|uniref:Uncharacterized protein n=1 Tax=Pleurodeles waltl TaxID=8319 RepID=A0AAV7S851_PLEWA|nr:hypothetical protein NDU88_000634 [Pleurodeles waltl]
MRGAAPAASPVRSPILSRGRPTSGYSMQNRGALSDPRRGAGTPKEGHKVGADMLRGMKVMKPLVRTTPNKRAQHWEGVPVKGLIPKCIVRKCVERVTSLHAV